MVEAANAGVRARSSTSQALPSPRLLAFTAVPAVLVVVVGNPLSGGLGHTWRSQPRDALCVLALAAWVAWAACCAQLVRGVVVHVRSGEVGTLGGTSVVDRVAARIAVGVLALTSMGASLALSSSAGASVPAGGETPGVVARHLDAAATPLRPSAAATPPPPAASAAYVVRPGDTLWSIADDCLADGAQWTVLAALNLGRDVSGGSRFVDPDHVEVGWSLLLPVDARGAHEPTGRRRAPSPPRDPTRPLPELVALGTGSLACAALARRARRRRRGSRFTEDPDLGSRLSEGAVDVATLLHRFDGMPGLASFEAANCLLARTLQGRAGPAIRAICVSPSGVSFWLTRPQADAPEGFAPVSDGAAWHVDHATLDGQEPFLPYCPIVLPVGDDDAGTWLVPLGPGHVLPLLGESAASLWRAARAAVGAWAWADTILVAEDPDDPQLLSEAGADPSVARHLLFFGDPASLAPSAARRTAVVTTAAVAASDLTILVDRQGATLHPMGRVVRPHLQSAETAQQLEELLTCPAAPCPQPEEAAVPARHSPTPIGRRSCVLDPGTRRGAALDHDAAVGGAQRGVAPEPGPPGGRARRLPGPAPPRRHHERPVAHARARVLRRRRRVQDAVQHGVRGPARDGSRRSTASSSFLSAPAMVCTRSRPW